MTVWDGNKNDVTDFSTDKYLQINNCGFQNIAQGQTCLRKRGRRDYHILLITDGECEALHGGVLHTLLSGNFILYAPGEEQRYSFQTQSTSLWCHFSGTVVEELLASCGLSSGVYPTALSEAVQSAFTALIRRHHQPARGQYANASLLELLYCLSDAVSRGRRVAEENTVFPILTYINANYDRPLSLSDLAKQAGYSKSRFSHLFSEATGTTPVKYQNGIRLKTSCEMLTSTELSVSQIAYACGFSDPLYYSKLFRQTYGIPPTEYRRRGG